MEKLAIFGGTGFIGSNFCKLYPEDVRVVNRDNEEFIDEKDSLYLISTTSNYNVFSDPTLDIETNLHKLMEQLPYTDENGIFNFVSSWFVYASNNNGVCSEESLCNPKGLYSITKRCAEQLIESYCTTFNRRYRILRLCNVIGKDPNKSAKKNALEFMIEKARNHETIDIYDGDNFRNYLHVEDCCRALRLVTESGNINEIYNIGAPSSHRIYDIIQYVMYKTKSNSKINIIETPRFHKQVQCENFHMNTDKLKKLGFVPKYDIWQTIDKILEKS